MIRDALILKAIKCNCHVIIISKTREDAALSFIRYIELWKSLEQEQNYVIQREKHFAMCSHQSILSINADRIDSIRGRRAGVIILDDISYLKDHQNVIYSVLGEAGVIML